LVPKCFFLKRAGKLRIIILRGKEKGPKQTAAKGGRHSKSLQYKGNIKQTNDLTLLKTQGLG
jgi:hypothetical protein